MTLLKVAGSYRRGLLAGPQRVARPAGASEIGFLIMEQSFKNGTYQFLTL